ncbi:MAG: copper resistance protein B [Alphaproteobacteria bacterium]|nr:copper resistance protein B [Alphaproteobacteria bacterium]
MKIFAPLRGLALFGLLLAMPATAFAQGPSEPGWPQPMNNDPILGYAILHQNELRIGSGLTAYRWDGEGWYGGNINRAWFSSEGSVDTRTGALSDSEVEALYARAISRYFNLQTGMRYDFGNEPGEAWGVFGVEGLAPLFFDLGAHAYIGADGRLAARIDARYDLFITQRLVLQPQLEANFYSKPDPRRGIGSGLSDIDTGLRLRYEVSRQFAPYIGVVYAGKFGDTANLARAAHQKPDRLLFTVGVRLWL